jgi:hypothetical protein
MANAAPATRERPTGPAVAIAAAPPVDPAEVPVELDEPEVALLEPDLVAVPVAKPEDPLAETAAVLPDPEAEPLSGTTGDESPAGMDAGAG